MIKLVKHKILGFEVFTVVWETKGKFTKKNFWSENHARTFIGRKWHHLDMNRIELEEVTDD